MKESPDDLHFFSSYPTGFGDGRSVGGVAAAPVPRRAAAGTSEHLYAVLMRTCMHQMTKGAIKNLSFVERESLVFRYNSGYLEPRKIIKNLTNLRVCTLYDSFS